VELVPITEPAPACRADVLGRVTAAAFGQRRKMLRTSLKQLVADPQALLEAAGIAGNLRAEDLNVKDFARLALLFERSSAGRA
jgi:16S rRNA (adenine1518-N6/adenine1519-N6)-dimethyltransferase